MTPAAFRKLALSLEGAMEGAHGGHPDFRAGGKVFASLGYPGAEWGMVKLAPEQQQMLVSAEPGMFDKMMSSPAFKSAMRSAGTVIGREITRSIFGTGRRR